MMPWLKEQFLTLVHHPVAVILGFILLLIIGSATFFDNLGSRPAVISSLILVMIVGYMAHFVYFTLGFDRAVQGFVIPCEEWIWDLDVRRSFDYQHIATDRLLMPYGKTFAVVVLTLGVPFMMGLVADIQLGDLQMSDATGARGVAQENTIAPIDGAGEHSLEFLQEVIKTALIVMITVEFTQLLSLNNKNYEFLGAAVLVTLAMDMISLFLITLVDMGHLGNASVAHSICVPVNAVAGLIGATFACDVAPQPVAKVLLLLYFASFATTSAYILTRVRIASSHRIYVMERILDHYEHWPMHERSPPE